MIPSTSNVERTSVTCHSTCALNAVVDPISQNRSILAFNEILQNSHTFRFVKGNYTFFYLNKLWLVWSVSQINRYEFLCETHFADKPNTPRSIHFIHEIRIVSIYREGHFEEARRLRRHDVERSSKGEMERRPSSEWR